MSEASPQLAQLLLPAGFSPGQQGAAFASRRPGDAGFAANTAASGADAAFQQRLRALLATQDSGVAEPGTTAALPDLALAGNVTALEGVPETPAVDSERAAAAAADPANGASGGKLLPESGNILPLSFAALRPGPTTSATDSGPAPELNRPLAEISGAPLSAGRDALARQLRPAVTDGRSNAQSDATIAAARIDATADDPTVLARPERSTLQAAGQGAGQAVAGADVRVDSAIAQAAATPAADVLRRLQLPGGGRERSAVGGEMRLPEFADIVARQSAANRVSALSDSSAAQFNLYARTDNLLSPGANLSPDAALRDLAAMVPMRQQTGEAGGAWANGLGQRLLMMADNGIEMARLRLNPASLGPLDIQVSIEDDRAQVWFGAQHSATRDALEAALPRLREMFAEQGLQLTRADVGERDAGGRGDKAAGDRDADLTAAAGELAAATGATPSGSALQMWGSPDGGSLDIYV